MIRRRTLAYCAAAAVIGFGYVAMIEASTRIAASFGRAMAEWQAGPASGSTAVGEKGS